MTRFLVFLLLITPAIQYRVEFGSLSFALMEPITLFAAGILIAWQITKRHTLTIAKDPMILLFMGMTVWASIIRPWAVDWQHGLSDARDWVVPLLGYIALVSTVRLRWRKWIGVFLAWVILLSILGIYQHVTQSARPFLNELAISKTGFLVSPADESRLQIVSAAVGFFTHPNGYAMYLFLGLMAALGWLESDKRRWYKFIVILLITLAIYWAYAKASLIVMVFAVTWFWLQHWFKRGGQALSLMGGIILSAIPFTWIALQFLPAALLNTFRWRVQLWNIALETIRSHPNILLVGNGVDLFAQQAFYAQPHNVYLYLLLEYGLAGLIFIALVISYLWVRGWRLHQRGLLRREPLLAGLWTALLGFFIIGLVESNLMGIENRMIFLLTAAFFTGLERETLQGSHLDPPHPPNNPAVSTHDSN
jgi:O-antigen ligase